MKRTYSTLALAVFLGGLSILSVTGCHQSVGGTPQAGNENAAAGADGAVLQVPTVQPGSGLRRAVMLPGQIAAFEETPIFVARIEGYLKKDRTLEGADGKPLMKDSQPRKAELVDIGDVVEEGELLAELHVPDMEKELLHKQALAEQAEAAIGLAKAAITRAEGSFKRWESEHVRISALAQDGSISEKLRDETEHELTAAEAAKQEAAAELAVATARHKVAKADAAHVQALLEFAKIRAPFKGVITQRNVDTGHYVQPPRGGATEPLFVIARRDKVRVLVDVPELEAAMVDCGKVGDDAFVRVQALDDEEIPGKAARSTWLLLDRATHTLRVEIHLDNADGRLKPGMYADVTIVLAKRAEAVTIPLTAVLREDGKTSCWCIEGGKAVKKPITLGLRNSTDVEVTSGLMGKETVIRNAATSVKEDQAVASAKKS